MKTRAFLSPRYRTFTGAVMPPAAITAYNAVQAKINACIREGREVPEHLLNASHKIFSEATVWES